MVLACQGLEQVTQRQGTTEPRGHRDSCGARNPLSVNWQSNPSASWVFSFLKALDHYASKPPVSRLNSWPSASWAAILGFVSCLELNVTFSFFHFLWKFVGSYRGWRWGHSAEWLLTLLPLFFSLLTSLLPFALLSSEIHGINMWPFS